MTTPPITESLHPRRKDVYKRHPKLTCLEFFSSFFFCWILPRTPDPLPSGVQNWPFFSVSKKSDGHCTENQVTNVSVCVCVWMVLGSLPVSPCGRDRGWWMWCLFFFFLAALGTQEHIVSFGVPFKIKLRCDIQ